MLNMKKQNFNKICRYLSPEIKKVIESIDCVETLCEIRLKVGMPVVLIFTDCSMFITPSGRLTSLFSNDLLISDENEVQKTFNLLCEYSMHSHVESIVNGYITIDGGNRVGVYGTAVAHDGKVVSVRNIRGLNIRISGSFENIAKPITDMLFCDKTENILICGPPSSGKTTILKDLCRILSDEKGLKTAVIDERNEFTGNYVGYNTDVLTCYPKAQGIMIAVRTLSPNIIVCDEVGTNDEISAVSDGLNSGVNFVMSIHCRNEIELVRKPQFLSLYKNGAVDYCVILGKKIGCIERIISSKELYYENNSVDSFRDNVCTGRPVFSIQT